MATAASTTTNYDSTRVLLHRPKPNSKDNTWSLVIPFLHLCQLIKYVSENIKTVERFVLVISGDALKEFLNDPIHGFPQIHRIYVYRNNKNYLRGDEVQYKKKYKNLRFWPEEKFDTMMQKIMIDHDINSSSSANRSSMIGTATDRLPSHQDKVFQSEISNKSIHVLSVQHVNYFFVSRVN
jgi:hypothetical protein